MVSLNAEQKTILGWLFGNPQLVVKKIDENCLVSFRYVCYTVSIIKYSSFLGGYSDWIANSFSECLHLQKTLEHTKNLETSMVPVLVRCRNF